MLVYTKEAYMYEIAHNERGYKSPRKTDWLKITPRYKSNFGPITKKQRRDVIPRHRDPKNKCLQPATAGRKPRKNTNFLELL